MKKPDYQSGFFKSERSEIMLLRKFCGIEKTDNGYLIHGDAGDIKLVFMTDDIHPDPGIF